MFVKVCGITRCIDALFAEELGASAVGFVFYKKSPRFIDIASVAKISLKLGPFIGRVGVFVNEAPEVILRTVRDACLTAVQLSGTEDPDILEYLGGIPVVKALHVNSDFEPNIIDRYKASAYLLDTGMKDSYGGTGVPFDWDLVKPCRDHGRIILAGGLNPNNIGDAISNVQPWGVDVSSGLESSPGVKDHTLMKKFFQIVKRESNCESNR